MTGGVKGEEDNPPRNSHRKPEQEGVSPGFRFDQLVAEKPIPDLGSFDSAVRDNLETEAGPVKAGLRSETLLHNVSVVAGTGLSNVRDVCDRLSIDVSMRVRAAVTLLDDCNVPVTVLREVRFVPLRFLETGDQVFRTILERDSRGVVETNLCELDCSVGADLAVARVATDGDGVTNAILDQRRRVPASRLINNYGVVVTVREEIDRVIFAALIDGRFVLVTDLLTPDTVPVAGLRDGA